MCKIPASELRAAATFASKDETKPSLKCVCVIVKDEGYEICATDSFRLITFSNDYVDLYEIEGSKQYLIPAETIKDELCAKDQYVEFGADYRFINEPGVAVKIYDQKKPRDEWQECRTEECWRLEPGKYVNYTQFLKEDKSINESPDVALNTSYLESACKAVKTAYRSRSIPIDLQFNSPYKPVHFNASTQQSMCKGIIMPIRMK